MSALPLDLLGDVVALARALVDIPSESRHEAAIADSVGAALHELGHLVVERFDNTVVARTNLGRPERVIIAGHLDTVPAAGNLPATLTDTRLYGLGSVDMKSSVAVALHLAAHVAEPTRDITFIFYECEEIEAAANGLGRLQTQHPDVLSADLAIVMEPSNGVVEAGCQGTLRATISASGVRAHTARAWTGVNAIHGLAGALDALAAYEPRRVFVDGLEYVEGLQAVGIKGGVAGNVVPDSAMLTVNHRFAPDRSPDEAVAHVRELFAGYDVAIVDCAPAARPGLDRRPAADFVRAIGGAPQPKLGWTDVARFVAAGTPALNFGVGDPTLAHTADEFVEVAELRNVAAAMTSWLLS